MSESNNKQGNQEEPRNPEEDIIWLILEACLNVCIIKETREISDNSNAKSKSIEGGKNRVFLLERSSQNNFKYYLGNFSIDKLENCKISDKKEVLVQGVGGDLAKNAKKNLSHTKEKYEIHTGFVNYNHIWDCPSDDKEMLALINPTKNKEQSFRYSISPENNNVNKIGSLKNLKFEIYLNKRCCLCGIEESHNNKLLFCQNDNNFFCANCDKTWHEQKEKKSLNLHLRTSNFKYTLAYFGNCPLAKHYNRPFEYFDVKEKQCFCSRCMDQFLNNQEKNKNIVFIEDYLKVKNVEEDFLNSRINSVCEEINRRLDYAEDVWNKIDKYEKKYLQELEDERIENLKKMNEEGFARQTFLCCIFMEIQRIIKEIDSKIIFIKNQRNNVDVSTFLYMNQIYYLYMQKELISNLDYLCSSNLEFSAKNIITMNDKEDKKYEPLKLEPFVDDNKDDYILNDL